MMALACVVAYMSRYTAIITWLYPGRTLNNLSSCIWVIVDNYKYGNTDTVMEDMVFDRKPLIISVLSHYTLPPL